MLQLLNPARHSAMSIMKPKLTVWHIGINSTTGIAGLTLGGGFGWLSRTYGMTVDNLLAIEVVTAEGKRLRCDKNHHADLFGASCGGGGNFGVVTSFEFKLHAVGPEELTVWAVIRDVPPLPFLKPDVHGTRVLILVALYSGDMEAGKQALAPLHQLGEAIANGFAPHPFVGFQQAFDPLLTPGARNYWKSHNFTELSDGLIEQLVEYGSKLPTPQSEIFIAQMGGATNRVAPDANAYPHRDVEFIMNVHTRWDNTSQDGACFEWAREFYDATKPFATGGVYVNFISEDEDRVPGAYGANYERLAEVKAKYDSDNFFRLNQNISPDK
ncbi:hypothetical protein PBPRB0731 [Photobacterium profundum SS9]|uniref:FAD-binding PCMH-type domain-containing protein n=2 Tax=Photobacterium profundum TaxID=74109 RepID=Q6LJC7_PHOPR|nr:hypothetical protein PBPRB0731 [Photobacterium profundum SS9]